MAFLQPKGKQDGGRKPKPAPQRLPTCWLCHGCNWWQFACERGTNTPVKSCFRSERCGIGRPKVPTLWKDATDEQKKCRGGTGPTTAAPPAGAAAPAAAGGTPWRRRQQQQQQQRNDDAAGGGRRAGRQPQQQQRQQQHGPNGAGPRQAAPKESPELVAARARARVTGQIVDSCLLNYGDNITTDRARVKHDVATLEVERLLEDESADTQSAQKQELQHDYDKYLALLGADDPIVLGLRKKIDAGAVPESQTAVAVRNAKTLLDLLVDNEPDDHEGILEARSALDAAKIANGSRESDCYQSAEAAHKQAQDVVDAIHADIEATKTAFDAIVAKQQKQATDLLAATEARDAAKKRVQERMLAISTKAPGILQPSDVQTMSERMQRLDTVTRHVHGLGTQNGAVPVDAMQRVMDCVAELMRAAPSTVFTQSVTNEPQATVAGGLVIAGGGASGSATTGGTPGGPPAQTAAAPTPCTSIAAMQAKFDARERERTAAAAREAERVAAATAAATAAAAEAARASTERAAEAIALQAAYDAEAATAAAAAAAAAAAQRRNDESPGLADGNVGHLSTDAVMAIQWGEQGAGA
jgi:hypothetical protein